MMDDNEYRYQNLARDAIRCARERDQYYVELSILRQKMQKAIQALEVAKIQIDVGRIDYAVEDIEHTISILKGDADV